MKQDIDHTDSLFDVINHLSEIMVFNQGSFNDFLKKLIKVIADVIPVDSCLIYFYDKDKKQLILSGSKKPHTEQIGKITLDTGVGITGWVAKHKKTVAIQKQAYKDKRFKYFKELPEDKYESFLSVPIINGEGLVGVINLQNKAEYKFTKKQIKTIESLVKLIASAFIKVALDRKISFLENKLEERKIIEKAKGVLMKKQNMSEDQAYHYIRKEAMQKRKGMKQIAQAVILAY
ncbi:MAG: hypothetical protein A3F31_01435 [Candidatus Levybacteria bacterium RIFCSPHIGHO2_12_FULL_38_12]|nr:MAG: hypothetical protein A3D75_02225 [Candidatus Levybacteria bacterium RIFCSPHIGHO2_02_FULL_37_18]OGH22344.1 MAG: hypothetical protein A3F31_01435 [Candidatus Levybacteria bacterium RIFCSPHIGHO2_12_FULL_38_12]OGH34988.1 MAG: hypothetical protein A3A47_03080 [Candidatus Levybacteria bacterium RIFCSPLOWO2_01_FULL_37_20]OGH43867.1 MAG: hypothetical protein A3J14_02055 [Candidatus Levybacteria bacterium RIFCSPLOWO2_02_FULL_37_18]OGH51056.1 MAG: hypothetical protein A3G13_02970 [Candidatus Levy